MGQEPDADQQNAPVVDEDEQIPSLVWVLADLLDRIASFMSPNDICCSLRPINKVTVGLFSKQSTVRLSQSAPHGVFLLRWDNQGAFRSLTLKQRRQFLSLVAHSGSLENLQIAFMRAGCTLTMEVLESAASGGHLPVCIWLREQGCPWGWQVTAAAARAGKPELVKSLYQQGCPLGEATLEAAALIGHRALCEWLLDHGCGWSFWAICAALRGGDVGLMEWLLLRLIGPILPVTSLGILLLEAAAHGCDLPTLKSLHAEYLVCIAARGGNAGFLNPVSGQPVYPDIEGRLLSAAAASPTPDWQAKMEWLSSLPPSGRGIGGIYESFNCVKVAALPDALSRLRWLRQLQIRQQQQKRRRIFFNSPDAVAAAAAGNADALSFLLQPERASAGHGGSGSSSSGTDSCSGGSSSSSGCTDSGGGGGGVRLGSAPAAALAAARKGHLAALKVLYDNGACPGSAFVSTLTALAAAAATEGHVHVVAWLAELSEGGEEEAGADADAEDADDAAAGGKQAASGEQSGLSGVGGNASPAEEGSKAGAGRVLTRRVAAAATHSGNLELLRWLRGRGCMCESDDGYFGGGRYAAAAAAEQGAVEAGEESEEEASEEESEEGFGYELAYEVPCLWGPVVLLGSARGCQGVSEELLEWLVQQQWTLPKNGNAYLAAAECGDLAAIRCLRRLGYSWGPPGQVFQRAAADDRCSLPVLRALLEEGCVVLWEGAIQAAEHRGERAWGSSMVAGGRGSSGSSGSGSGGAGGRGGGGEVVAWLRAQQAAQCIKAVELD